MNTKQQARWQHVVVIAAGVGLVCGGIMFAVGVTGAGSDRAAPAWVGAAVLASSVVVGVAALLSLRRSLERDALAGRRARGLFALPAGAPAGWWN